MGNRTEERGSRADRDRYDRHDRTPSRSKPGHRSRSPAERRSERRRDGGRERPRSPDRRKEQDIRRGPELGRERWPASRSAAEAQRSRLGDAARGRDSPRSWHGERAGRTDSPLAERNHSRQPERRAASKQAVPERLRPDGASDRRRSPERAPREPRASHGDRSAHAGRSPRPPPSREQRGRGADSPHAERGRHGQQSTPEWLQLRPRAPASAAREPERRRSPQPPPLPPPPPAALDFFSEAFDAALALRTPGLQPPNAAVRPLQMLQQCRFILPPELPESLAGASFERRPQEAREAAAARSGPAARRRQAAELKHPVVDRIAAAVAKGPLLLLRRAFEAGGRVRVVTRHARGVRGWAEGNLMAFDKHMNLVLADVEESYTVRLRIERTVKQLRLRPPAAAGGQAEPSEAGGAGQPAEGSPRPEAEEGGSGYEVVERSRTAFKQERRNRRLRQIFVRGSNVVLVSVAQPAAAAEVLDAGSSQPPV